MDIQVVWWFRAAYRFLSGDSSRFDDFFWPLVIIGMILIVVNVISANSIQTSLFRTVLRWFLGLLVFLELVLLVLYW
jgi:hypothetical protein